MCIFCHCSVNKAALTAADHFLTEFARAGGAMRRAEQALRAASQALRQDNVPLARQYDRTHKQLVRLRRRWNAIEHSRELPDDPPHRPRHQDTAKTPDPAPPQATDV